VCNDSGQSPSSGVTGTGVVTFNVDAGENVEYVFTNTKNGSVTIRKIMVGGTGTFTYTGTPNGTISVNNNTITQSVAPGTFTSTETVPDGWVLTSIVCSDAGGLTPSSGDTTTHAATFNVSAGENVECVFTNTKPTISTNSSIDSNKINDSITLG